MKEITNYDDVIDSRDVVERIEELEEYESDEGYELTDDEHDELAGLRRFAAEGEGLADWVHGETLIRDSYFEDYARDLADDSSAEPLAKAVWPFTCIDWEKAAEELQVDYTSIEFGDVTYWAR